MGLYLSTQQIKKYHSDGFLTPVDLITETEAAEIVDQLEWAEKKYPGALNPVNRNNAHLSFTFFDKLAHNTILLDAAEDLIGGNFSIWGSVLFIKEPSSPHFVSYHQDATYMGLEPHEFVSAWIALTPSNRETGCMTMVSGTHQDGIHKHDDTFHENNILTRGQKITEIDESKKVDLILKPGQMSLHHARTIHGSQPNLSQQRRIGFTIQGYMRSGTMQGLGENYWQPARGNPQHPDMITLKRPESDMSASGIAERDKVNQNWVNILYNGAEKKRAF
ncbi:MAG: non-heme Fe2+,alpha-ketoglutarate-dependent halogenase [Gammaproteobacteria bacterium]|jgi:non-heme Fe2+,alpha-ketoglutarate-dependent halogenase